MSDAYTVRPTRVSHQALMAGQWPETGALSWGPARYGTRFRARWNDQGLYLHFDVSDPEPWHTMTRPDDPIWEEEVVEIFLDLDRSGTHYAEIELSPANVVTDVRMIRGSPDKEMDLGWNLDGVESQVPEGTAAGSDFCFCLGRVSSRFGRPPRSHFRRIQGTDGASTCIVSKGPVDPAPRNETPSTRPGLRLAIRAFTCRRPSESSRSARMFVFGRKTS